MNTSPDGLMPELAALVVPVDQLVELLVHDATAISALEQLANTVAFASHRSVGAAREAIGPILLQIELGSTAQAELAKQMRHDLDLSSDLALAVSTFEKTLAASRSALDNALGRALQDRKQLSQDLRVIHTVMQTLPTGSPEWHAHYERATKLQQAALRQTQSLVTSADRTLGHLARHLDM
ncbi:MAG: hypothetical protein ACRCYU_19930, partial [Nocardioides sp.]